MTGGWGALLPDDVDDEQCVAIWGARAIYSLRYVNDDIMFRCGKRVRKTGRIVVTLEYLPDRQGANGDAEVLCRWLNSGGLEQFRKEAEKRMLDPASREHIDLRDGEFGIIGTPNGSYGYMYVKAWQLRDVTAKKMAV